MLWIGHAQVMKDLVRETEAIYALLSVALEKDERFLVDLGLNSRSAVYQQCALRQVI